MVVPRMAPEADPMLMGVVPGAAEAPASLLCRRTTHASGQLRMSLLGGSHPLPVSSGPA